MAKKLLFLVSLLLLGLSSTGWTDPCVVDVNNFSFELDNAGVQMCQAKKSEQGLAWKKGPVGGFIANDITCCDPNFCKGSCHVPPATDGVSMRFMQDAGDIYYYQILDSNVLPGKHYTLSIDLGVKRNGILFLILA